MAVMLRTRTRPSATVAKSEETPSATPMRRLRTQSANTAATRAPIIRAAKDVIEQQLRLIAKAEAAIDQATLAISNAHGIIEDKMRDVNITEHAYGIHIARLVEAWSNQRTDIDPKKYRAKVANDVFWASIAVMVTKAREHLNEREILEIADVVSPKSQGIRLKIERVDVKSRKKK